MAGEANESHKNWKFCHIGKKSFMMSMIEMMIVMMKARMVMIAMMRNLKPESFMMIVIMVMLMVRNLTPKSFMITMIMMIAIISNLMLRIFMVAMMRNLMQESFMMIMERRNSMVWDLKVSVKILEECMITAIVYANTEGLHIVSEFKTQNTKRNSFGLPQQLKLWLQFYSQTVSGRVQRPIQMSGRKHWEIHELLSANRKARKCTDHKIQNKIHS